MKRFFLCLLAVIAVVFEGHAQENEPDTGLADTIELDEVVIRGNAIEKYAAGSRIEAIDKRRISGGSHTTLEDLLSRNTAIYMKEYGNGMISSVSMRGTGSSHTAVLWNGININSLTAGSLDFALVPLAAIESVEIQYGSASSLYGSDAIGGAIHLTSGNHWDRKGLSGILRQEAGSFQTWATSGVVSYGSNRFFSNTSIYRKKSRNNFPFRNRSVEQKQNHAAYAYHGVVQELGYRINPQQSIALSGWYNFNDREIQPNMQANLYPGKDGMQDRNARISIDYKLDNRTGFYHLISGYVNDNEIYRLDNSRSKIATHRWVNMFQYEKDLSRSVAIKAGGEWMHIVTDVDGYQRTITEDRNDAFLSVNFSPFHWWNASINLRKTFMQGYKSPATPSIGNNIVLHKSDKTRLVFKTLAARAYRIPTLNDRYQPRSGNPGLLPENSLSAEAGFSYDFQHGSNRLALETTGYAMKVDDLIHWKPVGGDLWIPENMRKVNVHGLEMHAEYERNFTGEKSLLLSGNYAFTRSINQTPVAEADEVVGNQLPYTPIHTANLIADVVFHQWSAGILNYFTGKRYLNLSNREKLPAYMLTDLDFSRSFRFGGAKCDLTLRINNIFNIRYQNILSKAMPGTHFNAGVRFHFN